MGPSRWEQFSLEPAAHLVDNAPQKLATNLLANEEKSEAMRLMAGFSRGKEVTRHVKSDKLAGVTQRALRNPQY